MAFKMKGFPMMAGTKPMKMKKDAAMKMKKAAMQMKKEEAAMKLMKEKESAMKMGHSPKKAAKPDFIDIDKDGDTKESMKKASQDMKSAKKMKKSAMKLKGEAMKLKGEAMKMKTPMKQDKKKSIKPISESENVKRAEARKLYKKLTGPGATDKQIMQAKKLKAKNPQAFI